MARQWKWLVILATLGLLAWGCDRYTGCYWIGHTEFTVEFTVTDAETGEPIPGATVEAQAFSPFFYNEPLLPDIELGKQQPDRVEFSLVADTEGVAHRVCPKNTVIGEQSGQCITDTYVVYIPNWKYRILADSYQPTDWAWLKSLKSRQDAKRNGSGKALLQVQIQLHKSGELP